MNILSLKSYIFPGAG